MEGSIKLSRKQHKIALGTYRGGGDARVARRAHVLLLLNEGMSFRQIMEITFCSSDLVAGVKARFLTGGVEAAVAESTDDDSIPFWQVVICGWVMHKTPQDFGYFRTRWSCEILAELLEEQHGLEISGETIRRGLHALGFAWRRPRPIVGLSDPDYTAKMRRIRGCWPHSLLTKWPCFKTKSMCISIPRSAANGCPSVNRRRSKRQATT